MRSRDRFSCAILLFIPFAVVGQADTMEVEEITVSAMMQRRPLMPLPASVSLVDSSTLSTPAIQSILPAINNVAGVRMEERSPGSYRLSIRGSLLRSPFGVRNVKVYLDEMPLTNAGGETYLNLIDQAAIHSIEVQKGPDGSLYGANSGGVLRINLTPEKNNRFVSAQATAGSYDLYRFAFKTQQHVNTNKLLLNAAIQSAGGYREQSAMQRIFVNGINEIRYREGGSLRVLLLGSFLNYETPGGLTLGQRDTDPRAARPSTATQPGAEQQKAGIFNNTLLGSVTNQVQINTNWSHLFCVFGALTDFKNPFITNYEERDEGSFGFRTYLNYEQGREVRKHLVIGTEQQVMSTEIRNFDNENGEKTLIQAQDKVRIRQGFVFIRGGLGLFNNLQADLSVSMNFNQMEAADLLNSTDTTYRLKPQLMPRFGVSYLAGEYLSVRGIISRGYSAPTLQELRPSSLSYTGTLAPEKGWNYEAGVRIQTNDRKFSLDLAAFMYELEDAIVRRVDSAGNEYFVNAGGTFQPGAETEARWTVIKNPQKLVSSLDLSGSLTYYKFRFRNYVSGNTDFSGKQLTGVPEQMLALRTDLRMRNGLFLYGQYHMISALPLNDGNDTWTHPVTLLFLKAGWDITLRKTLLSVAIGCDNALDAEYSSGPDLNAFGGRFYNPSPGRNYFAQVTARF